VAKASPYYTNTVLFHTAGQNFDSWWSRRIIQYATNCDRYAIAPYILQNLNASDLLLNDTDAKLFRWLFAYPLMTTYSNGMPQQLVVSSDMDTEFSIYEMNHHTTHGDAPLEPRNKLVASLGGGLSVINTMLSLLKVNAIRSQCFFSFCQRWYSAGGIGNVRLWGALQHMTPGTPHVRPTGLALAAVNRVLGGDLVATAHSGDDPVFEAIGTFHGYSGDQGVKFPILHSYALRDGTRRGLIIVNLDVVSNQAVQVLFGEPVQGNSATCWQLASGSITNDNEDYAVPPQVVLAESVVNGFTNGVELVLPAHSLQCYEWAIPEGGSAAAAVLAALYAAARSNR
jgi:hypothetical protein